MSTAAVLALAMLLDAALGEPAWLWRRLPHPAVLMGRLIGSGDRRLNHGQTRRAKGVALLLALIRLQMPAPAAPSPHNQPRPRPPRRPPRPAPPPDSRPDSPPDSRPDPPKNTGEFEGAKPPQENAGGCGGAQPPRQVHRPSLSQLYS